MQIAEEGTACRIKLGRNPGKHIQNAGSQKGTGDNWRGQKKRGLDQLVLIEKGAVYLFLQRIEAVLKKLLVRIGWHAKKKKRTSGTQARYASPGIRKRI